jgi:predicted  nucleic acid-binding Zn-ribbon protein
MMKALETLLAVQKQDLELKSVEEKIAGLRKHRETLESAIAKEKARVDDEKKQLETLKKKSRDLSLEVDTLDEHIRNDERKIKEGLMSYKEMEAYRGRAEHDRKRMDHLEDDAIALMNQVEAREGEYQKKETEFLKWRSKIDAEIQEIDQSMDQQRQRITQGQTQRTQLLQNVDPALHKRYTQLQEDYDDPLSALRSGVCSGCKLQVSEITAERVREGSEIVTCEHCSRILYA